MTLEVTFKIQANERGPSRRIKAQLSFSPGANTNTSYLNTVTVRGQSGNWVARKP